MICSESRRPLLAPMTIVLPWQRRDQVRAGVRLKKKVDHAYLLLILKSFRIQGTWSISIEPWSDRIWPKNRADSIKNVIYSIKVSNPAFAAARDRTCASLQHDERILCLLARTSLDALNEFPSHTGDRSFWVCIENSVRSTGEDPFGWLLTAISSQ